MVIELNATRSLLLASSVALLAGCAPTGGGGSGDDDDSSNDVACDYPAGAVDPMALDEVLTPYSWATGIHADGRTANVDLGTMPCATDGDIDWSPFDVLLFVSIPAW